MDTAQQNGAKSKVMDPETMHFTFSDTLAGYVTSMDKSTKIFGLKTSDGREFQIKLLGGTYAEIVRNLDEPFQGVGSPLEEVITSGKYLFVYYIAYHEAGNFVFEAKHIILMGQKSDEIGRASCREIVYI